MDYKTILFEREGNVATIIMNRPEQMNSLTAEFFTEVGDAVSICEHNPEVRAVILAARGKAFCAGGDINDFTAVPPEERVDYMCSLAHAAHERVVIPIRRMGKPVIAAVNGVAAGGGFGLALACDLRIAATEARFCVAYSGIAISPDCGTSLFMSRLVGPAKALELYYFNDVISAKEALSLGLVNRVMPGEELLPTVKQMAARLAAGPSVAYALTKALINKSYSADLATHLQEEADGIAVSAATRDHREGADAFLEKRRAQFIGR